MTTATTIDTERSRKGLLLAGGLAVGAILAAILFVFFDPINLFAFGLQQDIVGTVEVTALGVGVALSFVSGATMIFTPCGLPLIFTMNTIAVEGRERGRSWVPPMALFTIGIVTTMAIWGVVVAFAGGSILRFLTPSDGSMRTTTIIYVALGVLMLVMALWEFRIVDLPRPARRAMPRSLNRLGPYPKSLGMGAALGGGFGIGCPFPTYQAVLAWAVIVGNPWYGAVLLAANALGRALPLWPIGAIAYAGGDQRGISRRLLGNTERSRLISGTGLAVFAGMMIVLWGLLIPIGGI